MYFPEMEMCQVAELLTSQTVAKIQKFLRLSLSRAFSIKLILSCDHCSFTEDTSRSIKIMTQRHKVELVELPDELLEYILKYLDAVSLALAMATCHRLRAVGSGYSFIFKSKPFSECKVLAKVLKVCILSMSKSFQTLYCGGPITSLQSPDQALNTSVRKRL